MRILITGGAGFIGSNLSKYLIKQNHEVIIIDDLSTGKESNLDGQKIRFIHEKVENLNNKIIKGMDLDFIVHLAAQASVPLSISQFYKSSSTNILSSIKIFEIARVLNIPVIYASSSAVYGNLPLGNDITNEFDILSPYALDKLTLENYAKLCNEIFSISSIGFRFFNVYGPLQDYKNPYSGVISLFASKAIRGEDIEIYGGTQTRDFIHVRDVCEIIYIAMHKIAGDSEPISEVLNLGTGKSISINDLAQMINKLRGSKSSLKILKPMDGDPIRSDGEYEKMKKFLSIHDFSFIELDQGLDEVIKWIETNDCK
jgi:UDP-glucose 4-epimerase